LTPVATEVWTFTRPPSRTFVVNASAAATVYLDTQAVLRKERAARERRLAGLAVAVLTVLGERDAFVRDAERRAAQALRMMTCDEGLSLREAVDWCGSRITLQEMTRMRRLDSVHQGGRDRPVG
jgi:hypothetical protein